MKLARFVTTLLMLSVLTTFVQAAEEAPWYDVELILFKQGDPTADLSENWPEDPGSPDWSNAVSLNPTPAEEPLPPYTLLPQSSWRLNAEFNALRRSRGELEPLFHQAWRQQVASNTAADAIYLGPDLHHRDDTPPAPFEGLIKINVNRYLHVALDLLLRGANSNLPPAPFDAFSSPTQGSIRFQGTRRMRSGELHYIDHPKMGALILISRVELPEPEPEPQTVPDTTPQTGTTAPPATDRTPPSATDEQTPKPAAN
ncbi:peptidoglycan binding protein CsiV [Sedimenticola sp.]|uniref:peptidoglycan binding protein CsiV n=1 Tax=Sedimenticola sp. TaxID=1940285 RepID=UPI003D09C33F